MQYQQPSEDQPALRMALLWVYSKARQLHAEYGLSRDKALAEAKRQYGQVIEYRDYLATLPRTQATA